MLDFDTVTKCIVSESICTAVFIDNEIKEPYTSVENPSDNDFLLPKKLYESFKKQNCLLDFYKYENKSEWGLKKKSILKNKDLIILDWELTDGSLKFIDTLEVLSDAVKTDSLPFVYIYTQAPELEKVAYNLFSYFSENSSKEIKDKNDLFIEKLDDLSISGIPENFKEKYPLLEKLDKSSLFIDVEPFCLDVAQISRQLLTNPEMKKEIKSKIFEHIKKKFEIEAKEAGQMCNLFFDLGKEAFGVENDEKFLNIMTLFSDRCYFPDYPVDDVDVSLVEDEKYTYLIHNTLVKISNKNLRGVPTELHDVVSADHVYSEFSKTICNRPRNFLAVLGLEMRNLFRRNASIIGKDINEINELAFFHHQAGIGENGDSDFYEFLMNMYKDELTSFLLDQKPTLFGALNNYKANNKLDDKLVVFRKEADFQSNLAKLNYYYSVQRINHNTSRNIRFGDIFAVDYVGDKSPSDSDEKMVSESPSNSDEGKSAGIDQDRNESVDKEISYLLCITAHCDCLRPKKINNYFHFVGGNEIKLHTGLTKGDSGFISYIKAGEKIICIEWKTSPFTIHIPPDDNDITKTIYSDFSREKILIKHLTCLNENHTQRIANGSFSWANRVGIDFAKSTYEGEM